MLGVHGVRHDRADYYLSDLAHELPVSSPGHWAGDAAVGLGLTGPLQPAEFHRLLEGRHPLTGRPMGSGRVAVPALDLTFSAPKSASVLFGLGGAEIARGVVWAHTEAVAGALSYLERHGIAARRRSGPERTVIPTTGMIAGQFTHAVNRNGDPHLHSHVVMANLVHGVDGRWTACDGRGISAHRHAAAAVYAAHLRAVLSSALGVRWVRSLGQPAEIAGVAPELLGEFSSRAADIRRHMYEVGVRSARGNRVAWAATRPAKESLGSYGELAAGWARRARALGSRPELGLGQPRRVAPGPPLFDEHLFAGTLSHTAHGGAHRRDVVAAFGAAARDGIVAASLERIVTHWAPDPAVGVAEPLHQRLAVVPARRHLRALGPRPVDPGDHEVWVDAAAAIDAYRVRWGLARSPEPLGTGPSSSGLASLPALRLADHIRITRQIEVVRSRLGRREAAAIEHGLGR
jgi:conjugative relaxase-like TrwC/TraI family protein